MYNFFYNNFQEPRELYIWLVDLKALILTTILELKRFTILVENEDSESSLEMSSVLFGFFYI